MMKGIQNKQIFQNGTFLSLAFGILVGMFKTSIQSTLTYTVDGDNVVKQTAHNVADPEALNNTADDLKNLIEETYKGYKGLKGVTLSVEIKDGKVVQDLEIDLSVASIDELRKALPEEYSGVGKNVSFKASKKMLTEHGYKEQTN